ncbi:hypothetical protein [Lacipirellula limnantheis]|nr:hypothetical protein [Lacipirellula limnantheis]
MLSVAVATALALAAGPSQACDYYYYRTVTTYVAVQPVGYYVTHYDDCGDAYQVRVVTHRTVRVPVARQEKVYC